MARADTTRAPALYVSGDILLVDYPWQFYALKHQRPDLKTRMLYFDGQFDFGAAPMDRSASLSNSAPASCRSANEATERR